MKFPIKRTHNCTRFRDSFRRKSRKRRERKKNYIRNKRKAATDDDNDNVEGEERAWQTLLFVAKCAERNLVSISFVCQGLYILWTNRRTNEPVQCASFHCFSIFDCVRFFFVDICSFFCIFNALHSVFLFIQQSDFLFSFLSCVRCDHISVVHHFNSY